MNLTELKIKNAKPLEKSYRLHDGSGLYLEVFPNGSKIWRFKYRKDGKETRLSLGKYPEVSLSRAREKAFEKRVILADGDDPVQKSFREKERPFAVVAAEWIKVKGRDWVPAHYKRIEQRINKYLVPSLGKTDIKEISADKVLPILRALEAKDTVETAHRVLGTCSNILRYAVACGYIYSDPCRDLTGALSPSKSKPFAAVTKPKEVGALMRNIDDYSGGVAVKYALLFSALTFCRPGEIRHAEWGEFDFNEKVWIIPAEKTKMRKEHLVPLSRQALALLDELKLFTGDKKYLFPNSRNSERPITDATVLAAIRSMGYSKEQMTAHGFRSMASTLLNEMGCPFDVIEAQLAHEGHDKIRAIYNRAQYLDERRELMQRWADHLDELRASPR